MPSTAHGTPPPRTALGAMVAGTIAASLPILVPVWLMALLLLVVAQTWGGRLAALTFLFGPAALVVTGARAALPSARTRGSLRLMSGLWAAALMSWAVAVGIAQDGQAPEDGRLRSVWLSDTTFRAWALANVVPELDQFTLGTHVVAPLDPFVDSHQATQIRASFQGIYHAMRQHRDFRAVGSNMPLAYLDLFGTGGDSGHLYVLREPDAAAAPQPVLLFLHGSAGPFKGYQWAWWPLVQRQGLTMVSPTYGFGYWRRDSGLEAVQRTLRWIHAQPELDGERVVLAGLSNGGLGVTRAALAMPEAWQHVVYLSPVMELDKMPAVGAALAAQGVGVTVVTGESDRRIPLSGVQAAAQALEDAGAQVQLHTVPEQDHFLFFAQPQAVHLKLNGLLSK